MKILNFLKVGLFGILGGFLGAWGGAHNTSKNWRRVLLPVLLCADAIWHTGSFWSLIMLSMIAVFSLGYGIPDVNDDGSPIGRFWYEYFSLYRLKYRHLWANILTRTTIAVFLCLSYLIIPILKNNWLIYGVGVLSIIMSYALLSWRDLGCFKVLGKKLLWSEMILYTVITFAISGAIIS